MPTANDLQGVAALNNLLVVTGGGGTILTSQIIPDLTPITIKNFGRKSGENAFLFLGKPDQRFTLDSSMDLPVWLPGTELEFLDSSGTLIHLDNSGVSSSRQSFRATLRQESEGKSRAGN